MSASGNTNNPQNLVADAVSEATLEFCNALAVHIQRAYPEKLSLDTWRAVLGSHVPEPSELDVETISLLFLVPNVAAQARFSTLTEYAPSKWMVEQEMQARGFWPPQSGESSDVYEQALNKDLKGVCFSGGGIRSATFNLGILQGLAGARKLGSIDYLSTVSGGGYIHQFLASWIECEGLAKVEEQLKSLPANGSRTLWPDPIRWLRRYSNYLTPHKGLLSADTWVAVSIWLRNTLLNQIVVISSLLFVLLLPHVRLVSGFDRASRAPLTLAGSLLVALLIILLCGIAASGLKSALRPNSRSGAKRVGLGGRGTLLQVLLPIFLALLLVAPFLALPQGSATNDRAVSSQPNLDGHAGNTGPIVPEQSLAAVTTFSEAADRTLPPDAGFWLKMLPWLRHPALQQWTPPMESRGLILIGFLFGEGIVVIALWRTIPQGYKRHFPLSGAVLISLAANLFLIHIMRVILGRVANLRFAVTFAPVLLLIIFFTSLDLAIGIIGNCMEDSSREWLARLRALSFLIGAGWLAVVGCSLLGPFLVASLFHLHFGWFGAASASWIGMTVSSVLAGKSRSTGGTADERSGTADVPSMSTRLLESLVAIGPAIFIIGLMLALSWLLEFCIASISLPAHWPVVIVFAVLAFTALLFGWRVDINEFSLHAFYRNRLARCYAGASNPDRKPNTFTGFAPSDARLRLVDLLPEKFAFGNPSLWKNRKSPPMYQGPFPIFCAAVNLSFGEDLAYQERKAASFAFTPLYCGYDTGWTAGNGAQVQFNGYYPTNRYASPKEGPHLSTAVAASGAALSPNEGYHTNPAMAFLLTVFNMRLGWWVPNPRNQRSGWLSRLSGATPVIGLPYLLRELFGAVSDNAPFVNLSDGGHFEDMGLYELVRRRCRNIIICDAEQDPNFVFEGMGTAIRKCRIDFGVEISLDLDALIPGPDGVSANAFVRGIITYPGRIGPAQTSPAPSIGNLLYIKSVFTGREPADIRNYQRQHAAFPGDTTLNQWFTESEFESYRRLGQFIGESDEVVAWLDEHF